MMGEITHNDAFHRLTDIMPRQAGISFLNVVNIKLSYIIDVFYTTVVVFDSWVKFIGIYWKYLMFTAIIPAIT